MIIAPHLPLSQFDRQEKHGALLGFALACRQGEKWQPEIQAGYLEYLRRQRKRLYPLAVRQESLLWLMLEQQIVPRDQVPLLLDLAEQEGRQWARKAIARYASRQFGL